MKALLDTNIIIHREAARVVRDDIGTLFLWLERTKFEKWIHPDTVKEIQRHEDPGVVKAFNAKMGSYEVMKTVAPDKPQITAMRKNDVSENDRVDTTLLNEVLSDRVDILISEDGNIHRKAKALGIEDRVFRINAFLERAIAQNPELVDYKVLAVKRKYFGNVPVDDPFFDSFKEDYPGFERWFNRKEGEPAYVCIEEERVLAFLYVKVENADEDYSDMSPRFRPCKRLKIGTFKVALNGYRLGERFLKIIFDNALLYQVDEIYVTIFDRTDEHKRLIELMCDWGFVEHGVKHSATGDEKVFVRDFEPKASQEHPKLTYPYILRTARKFIVPIYPDYHTALLPDSLLRSEPAEDFQENHPSSNAIEKAYISHSYERGLHTGDLIVFYRTSDGQGPAHHRSVATTVGVVQDVLDRFTGQADFVQKCKNRSVFSGEELVQQWNRYPRLKPFIVNFLYVLSFRRRPTLGILKDEGIITDAPRGFTAMTDTAFAKLLEVAHADKRYVVD